MSPYYRPGAIRYPELFRLAKNQGISEGEAHIAAAVAMAESAGMPNAVGDTNTNAESVGLWQIRLLEGPNKGRTVGGRYFTRAELLTPTGNAHAFGIMYKRESWKPWSAYKSGRYKQYLYYEDVEGETMGRALWLADAMREEGLQVHEEPGWKERGSATFSPRGVVCHHTADGPSGDYPSLRIVRDGRSDLPGPLAQIGIGRSGRVYIIASGRANHAGSGGWKGLTGNTSVFGIEAENTGRGEPWSPAILDAYIRVVKVLCKRGGIDPGNVCGHKEWTTRKIDPNGIDMNWFRDRVRERLVDRPKVPDSPPIKLFNVQSQLTLDIAGGHPGAFLVQFYSHGEANQKFVIRQEGVPEGEVGIIAVHSGLALDVDHWSKDNGAKIVQWHWNPSQPNQRWKIREVSRGIVVITSVHSGKAIDVPHGEHRAGLQMQQWDDHGGTPQQFFAAYSA